MDETYQALLRAGLAQGYSAEQVAAIVNELAACTPEQIAALRAAIGSQDLELPLGWEDE